MRFWTCLIATTLGLILVAATLAPSAPEELRWVSCGLGLFLLILLLAFPQRSAESTDKLVSELHRVRNERDEIEHLFDALIDTVPSRIFYKDRDSKFIRVNRALSESQGLAHPADMVGKTDFDYFSKEHAAEALRDELRILQTGRAIESYVEKETFPDGRQAWVLTTKLPFRDRSGAIIGTCGISNDITDMVLAQRSAERERNVLRSLIDSIPDNVYIRDTAGRYIVGNRALARFVGCSDTAKVLNKTPCDFYPPELAEAFLAEDRQVIETGEAVINRPSSLRDSSGSERQLLVTKVPVIDEEGEIFGVLTMNRDVTSEVEARNALRQTEQRMQEIMDNSPAPVYVKALDGSYLVINRRFEELFGIKRQDVIGKTDLDFMPDLDAARTFQQNDRRVASSGKPIQIDEDLIVDGEPRTFVSSKFPLRDIDGEIYAVGGISTDITDRKIAEEEIKQRNAELREANDNLTHAHEQLIQAEKMESVGRLAAGVAHEVKNPLAMIGQGLEVLSRRLPPDDAKAHETVQRMRRGIDRAKNIVRGLVDYSSARQLELAPMSVNAVVLESLDLAGYELRHRGITIEKELADKLPPALIDQTKIEQVLINLFINAAHVMEEGGILTVRTELAQLEEMESLEGSRSRERRKAGDPMIKITILDTGPGIPEDDLRRIFDPFFTTKATGKGTGLGLAVSRKIADMHGGTLVLRNRADRPGAVGILTLRVAGPGD